MIHYYCNEMGHIKSKLLLNLKNFHASSADTTFKVKFKNNHNEEMINYYTINHLNINEDNKGCIFLTVGEIFTDRYFNF